MNTQVVSKKNTTDAGNRAICQLWFHSFYLVTLLFKQLNKSIIDLDDSYCIEVKGVLFDLRV